MVLPFMSEGKLQIQLFTDEGTYNQKCSIFNATLITNSLI